MWNMGDIYLRCATDGVGGVLTSFLGVLITNHHYVYSSNRNSGYSFGTTFVGRSLQLASRFSSDLFFISA